VAVAECRSQSQTIPFETVKRIHCHGVWISLVARVCVRKV
jgi:hypothetical protein